MRLLLVFVRVLGLGACGRVGFAPGGDGGEATTGDGAIADDGVNLLPLDAPAGPSHFGTFPGTAAGRALALVGPHQDLIIGGWISTAVDLGGGPLPVVGGNDLFIARFDTAGDFMWARTVGSMGGDTVNDVATDAAENVYVAGFFGGPADFGNGVQLVPSGDTDAYLASYTGTGAFRWVHRIGTATVGALDSSHAVAVGPTEVVVTGLTHDTADAGGPPFTCNGASQAMFLAAYDLAGTHLWSRCYGNSSFESARGVAIDPAGNIYITGYYGQSLSLGGASLPSTQGLDAFVASFTSAGTFRWAHGFGGNSDDWGNKIAVDAAGNVTASGFFTGTTDLGGGPLTASGAADGYLVSYDTSGAFRWAKQIGGSGCDQARHVRVDAAGDVYVAGTFSNTANLGGPPLTASGPFDGFVGHLGPDGTHRASFAVGGTLSDEAQDVIAIPGGLVVIGRTATSTSACPNAPDSPEGQLFLDRF